MSIFVLLFATTTFCVVMPGQSTRDGVAAVVDGYEISDARVDRYLNKTLGQKDIPEKMMSRLRAEATDHLINRHLVLLAIESTGIKAGDSQIKYELSKLEDRLKEIDKTLDDHLSQIGSTQLELEYEFRWQLGWEKYLEKHLTPSNLEKHYKKNQRQFDGTEVRLAHVLINSDSEQALKTATNIRDQIVSGKVSWNKAVEEFSIAESSAGDGGDVGWINFHGPMVPEFCKVGIKLNQGEISQPVLTRFGIHIIKCTDVRSGKVGLSDSKQDVRRDAMRFLFDKLASKQKLKSKIKTQ